MSGGLYILFNQREFKYTEHKPFGRRYLGVTRTTMSSAVHILTQVKVKHVSLLTPPEAGVLVRNEVN
jgi:hypothetical protein